MGCPSNGLNGDRGEQLSIVAGLVVRHGDLSHEMTLSHEGRRPECDNVNRCVNRCVSTQTSFEKAISC